MNEKGGPAGFVPKVDDKVVSFNSLLGKSILVSPNEEQFDLLTKKLKQQLDEGRGEVIVDVSVLNCDFCGV